MQWSGPGCQVGDIAFGKMVHLANEVNASGIYSEIDNFISGSTMNQCRVSAGLKTNDFEISWFIDLGSRYSVETGIINYNYDGDSCDDIDVCDLCLFELFTYEKQNKKTCDFQFLISNANFSYTIYDDNNSSNDYFPFYEFRCNADQIGQFIQLKLDCYFADSLYQYVSICDIAIVGKPDIQINCTNCLQNDAYPCGNGIWCEMCKPGWLPPDCKKPCEFPNYGINCLSCHHHCKNVSCDAFHEVLTDPELCVSCDMWYINPGKFCRDYLEKLDPPFINAIKGVDVSFNEITVHISYDKRIASEASSYYMYDTEYSVDNFTSYITGSSKPHLDNSDYLVAKILMELSSDVQFWIRTRLYREQDGIRETGDDPSSVLIRRICSATFTSNKCDTLVSSCDGNCELEESDDIYFMFRKSGSATWSESPVQHGSCHIIMTVQNGGKYEAMLIQRRYESGVMINVQGSLNLIDIENCQEITVVIILAVFLGFFVLTTLCLAVLICGKGKYFKHIQDHSKKEDAPQLKDIESSYLNITESVDAKEIIAGKVNVENLNAGVVDDAKYVNAGAKNENDYLTPVSDVTSKSDIEDDHYAYLEPTCLNTQIQ